MTRTRLDFQSPNSLSPYTEIVSGGLPPYTASSSNTNVATVAQATSPNLVASSDSLTGWVPSGSWAPDTTGPNGAKSFSLTGNGSPQAGSVNGPGSPVVAGNTYIGSFWQDPSHIVSGSPALEICDISGLNIVTSDFFTDGLAAGRFHCGPAWTCPTNLVPFSDMPSAGWALEGIGAFGTGGPGGAKDIEVGATSEGGGHTGFFSVIPGQVYSLSMWVDASQVTAISGSGWISIHLTDGTYTYAEKLVSAGTAAARMGFNGWVCPAGVTSICFYCNAKGLTLNSGQKLKFSQPMLEQKSSASGYYIASDTPKIVLFVRTNGSTVIASGQKWSISQPQITLATYDYNTYISQTSAWLITPKYRGSATITYTDSTP